MRSLLRQEAKNGVSYVDFLKAVNLPKKKFIYSFGICHLSLLKEQATFLTTLFWLFFTIFRFLSAIQARYMSPKLMLWISLFGCAITTATLTITTNLYIIYVAVSIFGASMSNCFATGFLYAQNFIEVSGKLGNFLNHHREFQTRDYKMDIN